MELRNAIAKFTFSGIFFREAGLSEEELATARITEGLVRVSVGIEDWRDLLQDFEQALDSI